MKHNHYIEPIEAATGTPYRDGNSFTILQNGDEIFPAMLTAIREAKTSIEFLSYLFWRSKIATEFANALCERARAGVTVRLLIDAVGGASMSLRLVARLERAGVKMSWFRPGHTGYLRKLNNRTHRKILIADGRIGFTGGVGIADIWLGSAQDPKHWRETHCRIEGPACTDLFTGFAENWEEATGELLTAPPPAPRSGSIAIHTTISTAGGLQQPTHAECLVSAAFAAARERLWITTGYFVPSSQVVAALVAAVHRGVDVRVLTNGALTDHHLALLAGRASYQKLLDGGVNIYEYQKTMHHAKIITADRAWATVGSINLDARSLVLNDELNVSLIDPGIVGEFDAQFLRDLEDAKPINPETWPHRGRLARLIESGSSILRNQL